MTQRVVNYKYGTGNPVLPDGSIDVRDGIDNLQSLDIFMNADEDTYNQRDGEIVKTLAGAVRDIGVQRIGDFTTGCTVTARNQGVLYETDGTVYVWLGALPKVVTPASSPATTGGISPTGDWLDIGDASAFDRMLSLLSESNGSSLIGFEQSGTGSVPRTSQDKMRERITPQDKGAVGDGVTNDTAAFVKLEADHPAGQEIDMLGKTYYVDAPFYGHHYYNGKWVGPFGESRTRWQGAQHTGAGRIAFGDGALAALPDTYSMGETATVVAEGSGALGKVTQVKQAIAIGTNAMGESLIARDDIAIGDSALKNIQARDPNYSQTQFQGTRMVAIGGNAGYFAVDAWGMVLLGRNSGHCVEGGNGLVAIGGGAVGGYAPIGLSGKIENGAPWGVDGQLIRTVGIGFNALAGNTAMNTLAIGGEALSNNKRSDNNVAVGPRALNSLDIDTGFNGGTNVVVDIAGTYSHAGNVLTLNFTASGVAVGDKVRIRLLDGGSQTFQNDVAITTVTTVINANSFTVNHPISRTASGTAHLYGYETAVLKPLNERNTAIGSAAGEMMKTGTLNTLGGYDAGGNFTGGNRNTIWGAMAAPVAVSLSNCVMLGSNTCLTLDSGTGVTALGESSLRTKIDGTPLTGTWSNITGVGFDTRVSGDNQVQLGSSVTTTYVYGTVQNRSDARDKTDISDTQLGIEFIMGLRPVDGRWDMRDDYVEEYQVQVGIDDNAEPVFETRTRQLPRDGSKARTRKHHWFIAQEVKELCDKLGVDFGGYQDHSINEGCDVLSLGYDEFIPPTVKAVQQCWIRLDELEKRISALEEK